MTKGDRLRCLQVGKTGHQGGSITGREADGATL